MPCILVQNKIDLVNENDAKNDASLKDFALKNNFVKSFRTSVKKNIGVNETMDFFIGYIVDKINEMKKKKSEQKKIFLKVILMIVLKKMLKVILMKIMMKMKIIRIKLF